MRSEPNSRLDRYRIKEGPYATREGLSCGAFNVGEMMVISSGLGGKIEGDDRCSEAEQWEHVSVSLSHRTPTWGEMCRIKDLFWYHSETVVQFHPPRDSYVNNHPHCLHMWKQVDHAYTLPPTFLTGIKPH